MSCFCFFLYVISVPYKMIFKESWPKKINVCYMGDLYTWQIHTNYITTLFWWFFFMKVLGKLKMWILALNVELKMQFSLKYVVCRMYRWKWPEKMLIQREKMGASWFESSVRISANYNESDYGRTLCNQKILRWYDWRNYCRYRQRWSKVVISISLVWYIEKKHPITN